MHSYIGIYQFTPQAEYKTIEELIPFIDQAISDQNVESVIGIDKLSDFKENILHCMNIYYKLLGITDEVISGKGKVEPRGILPRYVESLIRYFQNLKQDDPNNKEIRILEYSGVTMIKIRYKYTESVIKKLVKLGLKDQSIFKSPLKIFLKGGALHDLIGMQFLCSSPYEKIWVARAMYNFFEYNYRTDDHLVYGFYTVERKSGYRGLHCDHTFFDPRFDASFSASSSSAVNDKDIFSLYNEKDDDIAILDTFKTFFNIEIQLHTAFENLWSGMEHRNSYNIQAKGTGRSPEIAAQWKLLSDNMQNLAMQFERLQIDTEQACFKSPHREGYVFIKHIFEEMDSVKTGVYATYQKIVKKIEDLEVLFAAREISRQDYVEQLLSEIEYIHNFVKTEMNPTIQLLFRLVSALIYYELANHRQFFNTYDLHQFVKKALQHYEGLHIFIAENNMIYKRKIINVVIISRILQLSQKYGYGLIDLKDVTMTYSTTPVLSYAEALSYFETGISLLNKLTKEDMESLQGDNAAYIKMIHQFDIFAQEWELFQSESYQCKFCYAFLFIDGLAWFLQACNRTETDH